MQQALLRAPLGTTTVITDPPTNGGLRFHVEGGGIRAQLGARIRSGSTLSLSVSGEQGKVPSPREEGVRELGVAGGRRRVLKREKHPALGSSLPFRTRNLDARIRKRIM